MELDPFDIKIAVKKLRILDIEIGKLFKQSVYCLFLVFVHKCNCSVFKSYKRDKSLKITYVDCREDDKVCSEVISILQCAALPVKGRKVRELDMTFPILDFLEKRSSLDGAADFRLVDPVNAKEILSAERACVMCLLKDKASRYVFRRYIWKNATSVQ